MSWLADNWQTVLDLAWRSLYLAGIPLLIGFVASIPLGWVASRWAKTSGGLILTTLRKAPALLVRKPRSFSRLTTSIARSESGSSALPFTISTPMNSPWPRTSPMAAHVFLRSPSAALRP